MTDQTIHIGRLHTSQLIRLEKKVKPGFQTSGPRGPLSYRVWLKPESNSSEQAKQGLQI